MSLRATDDPASPPEAERWYELWHGGQPWGREANEPDHYATLADAMSAVRAVMSFAEDDYDLFAELELLEVTEYRRSIASGAAIREFLEAAKRR